MYWGKLQHNSGYSESQPKLQLSISRIRVTATSVYSAGPSSDVYLADQENLISETLNCSSHNHKLFLKTLLWNGSWLSYWLTVWNPREIAEIASRLAAVVSRTATWHQLWGSTWIASPVERNEKILLWHFLYITYVNKTICLNSWDSPVHFFTGNGWIVC